MFAQILRCIQCALLLAPIVATATRAAAEDASEGFAAVGEYPWEGWHGPLGDGLHGLRFGTGGFEVNATMREKGLASSNARAGTLRFEGEILGAPAELVAEFTGARPSDPGAQLWAVQIRWLLRGLPQAGMRRLDQLDRMLAGRYGQPVLAHDDPLGDLETGAGALRRLYYGPEARAWLAFEALGQERFSLLIRLESPQLSPAPARD